MCLSETATDIKHHRHAVDINRWTYYISQGRVETPVRTAGQFSFSFVANLFQYSSAKNYQTRTALSRVHLPTTGVF